MPDEFKECLEAARYIVKHRGVADHGSVHVYAEGELRIERTNTGDIEVVYGGTVVLFAPHLGFTKQLTWVCGDWVERF